ncbi:MAG: glucose 1-dehydrogenase [Deltaproteobacteria bacterium]|nr:glucose 1-dehydrogenase [Deltaproteobacteria bacterium]
MSLKDKVAFITGAGGGIGRATALRFASEGAKIVASDIVEESLKDVAKEIKDRGGQALASVMDHTKKDQVTDTVEKALKEFGRIDVLCNIAGINKDALCRKMSEDVFDEVIAINLKGPWLCCQSVIPAMIEQKSGAIINTSSIGAHGNLGQTNYASAKAGVIALSKSLALELARYNVTVNTVAPGATDTPLLRKTPQEFLDKFMAGIPLKRFATPEELASVYLFFASNEATYITGQIIYVAGGLDMVFK